MATTLSYQLENDPAFQDLSPFFNDRLPHIIMRGELHKHIYKFAGTSVWLEQHGVHLMLSRVIYSQQGKKMILNFLCCMLKFMMKIGMN